MTSVNPSEALRRGHLLRDFEIPGVGLLSEFRARSMLLLAYGDESRLNPLAVEMSKHADELRDANVRSLIVLRGQPSQGYRNLEVVSDDGSVVAALRRQNSGQDPGWAVCITDRFGEIFYAAVGSRGDAFPSLDQLIDWADFAARSCDECFPPEWPVL